jgi:hypothetical protein
VECLVLSYLNNPHGLRTGNFLLFIIEYSDRENMVSLRAFVAAALLAARVPPAVLGSPEGQQAVSVAIENHGSILSNITSSAYSPENTLRPRIVVSSPPTFSSEFSSPDVSFVKIFNDAMNFRI